MSYNIPGQLQRFAGDRGLRDAENRAARVIADNIRSRLASILPRLPAGDALVITSGDGTLARIAAHELNQQAPGTATALEGGTAAWGEAGLPLEKGATRMGTPADDPRLSPRHRSGDVEAAMRTYLAWEIDLVNQMATDDDQRFRILTA